MPAGQAAEARPLLLLAQSRTRPHLGALPSQPGTPPCRPGVQVRWATPTRGGLPRLAGWLVVSFAPVEPGSPAALELLGVSGGQPVPGVLEHGRHLEVPSEALNHVSERRQHRVAAVFNSRQRRLGHRQPACQGCLRSFQSPSELTEGVGQLLGIHLSLVPLNPRPTLRIAVDRFCQFPEPSCHCQFPSRSLRSTLISPRCLSYRSSATGIIASYHSPHRPVLSPPISRIASRRGSNANRTLSSRPPVRVRSSFML